MSLFKGMTSSGLEESQDRLGGGFVLDADIHVAKIKVMYAEMDGDRVKAIHGQFLINGKDYKEIFYVTTREGNNFFLNKNDKTKKVPLPAFTTVNDICLLTTGKEFSDQDAEPKMVNVYDADQKKELPKSVPVLTELTGQTVLLGLLREKDFQKEKSGDDYVPKADGSTRESNVTDKVFREGDMFTVAELRAEKTEALFHKAWSERNKGQVRDKTKNGPGAGVSNGKPGAAPQASAPGAGGTARPSLFAKKS